MQLDVLMKKMGVKHKSLFWWIEGQLVVPTDQNHELCELEYGVTIFGETKHCSAYTVAELGEMLPTGYMSVQANEWHCENLDIYIEPDTVVKAQAPTEADARAKMLIYLLENKLITL